MARVHVPIYTTTLMIALVTICRYSGMECECFGHFRCNNAPIAAGYRLSRRCDGRRSHAGCTRHIIIINTTTVMMQWHVFPNLYQWIIDYTWIIHPHGIIVGYHVDIIVVVIGFVIGFFVPLVLCHKSIVCRIMVTIVDVIDISLMKV